MSGVILIDEKMCDKKQDEILEDASGLSSSIYLTMKFAFRNYFRQADKNGDGKISVEEIITIFKVSRNLLF